MQVIWVPWQCELGWVWCGCLLCVSPHTSFNLTFQKSAPVWYCGELNEGNYMII